jgi:hypothetical protein
MRLELYQSKECFLTTHSGLAIIRALLQKTKLRSRLIPKAGNPDISHGDVVTAYLGLLCQGKNDVDHIEGYAPIFAYLGQEGYCIMVELREGKTHCQHNTPDNLIQ